MIDAARKLLVLWVEEKVVLSSLRGASFFEATAAEGERMSGV
jgi:hypothetical protein